MSPGRAALRRYLLGATTEEENAAIEEQYFSDERALDAVGEAEEALIDDYLAARLSAAEKGQFERVYLASPDHRRRVAVVRALQASVPAPLVLASRRRIWYAGVAVAATVLIIAGIWWSLPQREAPTIAEDVALPVQTAPAPPASPVAPRVFAVTLSPVTVRAAGETEIVVIPDATDVLAIDLLGTTRPGENAAFAVRLRTVSGEEIWQGKATVPVARPEGVIARVEIPAARLQVEDYIVVLSAEEGRGPQEIEQYFLRVRR